MQNWIAILAIAFSVGISPAYGIVGGVGEGTPCNPQGSPGEVSVPGKSNCYCERLINFESPETPADPTHGQITCDRDSKVGIYVSSCAVVDDFTLKVDCTAAVREDTGECTVSINGKVIGVGNSNSRDDCYAICGRLCRGNQPPSPSRSPLPTSRRKPNPVVTRSPPKTLLNNR